MDYLKYFLGIGLAQSKEGVIISQRNMLLFGGDKPYKLQAH